MSAPRTDTARLDTGLSAAIFALSVILCTFGADPLLGWHDTAEFAAMGRALGVAHAPGEPLTILWVHAAQVMIPLGDAAWRAAFASALALGAALSLFYRVLRAGERALPAPLSAAFALLPLGATGVWLQGTRPEVYAPQLLISVLILWSCLRLVGALRGARPISDRPTTAYDPATTAHEPATSSPDPAATAHDSATSSHDRATTPPRPRALLALGLCFGLGGANHPLLALWLLPLALLAIVWARAPVRALLGGALAGLVGLLPLALLPLRGLAGGTAGWGDPRSLSGFIDLILAREWYWFLDPQARLDQGDYFAAGLMYLLEAQGLALGLALLLLLFVGCLPLVRQRPRALAFALGWLLCALITQHPYDFDPRNPDVGGYFAGASLALVWLGHLGASALLGALRDRLPARRWAILRWTAPALLMLLALTIPRPEASTALPARYARALVHEVPPDGALLSSDYATHFLTSALAVIEGERPDVARIFRGQATRPWYIERLRTTHPRWAEVVAALPHPEALRSPAIRIEPGAFFDQLGPLRAELRPRGLLLCPACPEEPRAAQAHLDAWAQLPAHLPALSTQDQRMWAYHRLSHAQLWAHSAAPGAPQLAQAHRAAAAALVGEAAVAAFLSSTPQPLPGAPDL